MLLRGPALPFSLSLPIGSRSSIYSCYARERLNCKFTSCSRLYSATCGLRATETCITVIVGTILNGSTRRVLIRTLNILCYVTLDSRNLLLLLDSLIVDWVISHFLCWNISYRDIEWYLFIYDKIKYIFILLTAAISTRIDRTDLASKKNMERLYVTRVTY